MRNGEREMDRWATNGWWLQASASRLPNSRGSPRFLPCQPSRFLERQCFDRIYPVCSRKIGEAKFVSSAKSQGDISRTECLFESLSLVLSRQVSPPYGPMFLNKQRKPQTRSCRQDPRKVLSIHKYQVRGLNLA